MACNRHKKREHGGVVPVFRGLAADVNTILSRMHNIHSVKCGTVRRYRGNSKVQMEPWYRYVGMARAVVYVCDNQHGECEIIISTHHPGPILRLLRRELKHSNISVSYIGGAAPIGKVA